MRLKNRTQNTRVRETELRRGYKEPRKKRNIERTREKEGPGKDERGKKGTLGHRNKEGTPTTGMETTTQNCCLLQPRILC